MWLEDGSEPEADRVITNTRHTQSLGDFEFVVNSGSDPKPNKTCNHGEWAITFAATKAAFLFAYPHWTKELVEYEKFIVGQFAAILDMSQHL